MSGQRWELFTPNAESSHFGPNIEYDVPGDVHEIYNLLERAYVLEITDYKQLIREHRELNTALLPQNKVEMPYNLEEAIRLHVKHVCEKYNGNITKVAEALGTSRNTVRKYLGIRN